MQWHDDESAMETYDDMIEYHLFNIAFCVIAIGPSCYRYRNTTTSHLLSSCHRTIVIALSLHCTIASSSSKYGRKCRLSDDAIVNCKALSGFHTHLLFKKLSNLFLWRKAFSNCLVHENFPVHRKKKTFKLKNLKR